MKRIARYTIAGIAALLLVVAAGLGWLLGTNSGARWMLDRVSRFAPVALETRSIEGRLWGKLRIRGLTAAWPDGEARIEALNIHWQPYRLLIGQLGLNELTVTGARIRDNRPEMPRAPGFHWPTVQGSITPLPVWIRSLKLEDITFQRLDRALVRIDQAEAGIRLSRGTISIMNMGLILPQFEVSGTIVAGLSRPSLRTDASIVLKQAIAGLDSVSIRTDLGPAEAPAQLKGSFHATGQAGQKKMIEVDASVGVTDTSLIIETMQAKQPGRHGSVTGQGAFAFAAQSPAFRGKFVLHELDLSKETQFFSSLSGAVGISGSTAAYQGSVSLMNKGTGWKTGRIAAEFQGTRTSLELTSLEGGMLDGTLTGSARADWETLFSLSGSLKARRLNPALVAPEWNGRINFDLKAAARLPAKKKPRGSLSLRLLDSRVRGRPLTGRVDARLKNGSIAIDQLILHGKGFDAKASGELAGRVDFLVDLPDLALLKPGAEGRAGIKGWVRKREQAVSGSIAAEGRRISLNGIKASSVDVNGWIEDKEDAPFSVTAAVRGGTYNFMHVDSLSLNGAGTLTEHTIRASLHSSIYTIAARVTGAYREQAWQGSIIHLSGSDEKGIWKAVEPALVAVSAGRFSLSPLVVSGNRNERIELQASMAQTPLSGSFSMGWQNLDLSRANTWITGATVSGLMSGQLTGKILPEGRLDVTAGASLSQAIVTRRMQNLELKIELRSAELAAQWREQAMEATLSLVFSEYGRIDASLQAPVPAQLPVSVNRNLPLRADIAGKVREAGTLSFLFPGLVQQTRGQLALDISLGGTWASPDLTGSLHLAEAGGYIPAAGIRVADIQLDARMERSTIRIESFSAKSGPGQIQGKAAVTLDGLRPVSYEGSLQGERFQALLLSNLRMQINPRITFSGTQQKLTVRGEATVPELLVYGPPRDAPVQASTDVVIVGAPEEEKTGRMEMDVEIKVVLGDRVIVKTAGVDAQLNGQVVLTARSLAELTGKGEIKTTRGKYSIYGVNLDIERGRLLFAGGPIGNPTLDILAVRTVNEVKAGVLVNGTLKKPRVKLYSEPAMPDADVLAYVVLGHPLGQDREQGTLLMRAAAALLSRGESAALQDQIKNRLGVDTIDIEAGEGDVARSLVTIGKYLSSRLYISYGYALFSGESLFRMRYKFGKRWELESRSGAASGLDLYYTIQFD